MFCSKCGSQIKEGEMFCRNCGNGAMQQNNEQGSNMELVGYQPNNNQSSNMEPIGYQPNNNQSSNMGPIGYQPNNNQSSNIGSIGYQPNNNQSSNMGPIGYQPNNNQSSNMEPAGYQPNNNKDKGMNLNKNKKFIIILAVLLVIIVVLVVVIVNKKGKDTNLNDNNDVNNQEQIANNNKVIVDGYEISVTSDYIIEKYEGYTILINKNKGVYFILLDVQPYTADEIYNSGTKEEAEQQLNIPLKDYKLAKYKGVNLVYFSYDFEYQGKSFDAYAGYVDIENGRTMGFNFELENSTSSTLNKENFFNAIAELAKSAKYKGTSNLSPDESTPNESLKDIFKVSDKPINEIINENK